MTDTYVYRINDLGRFPSEEEAIKKATKYLMANSNATLKLVHRAKIYPDSLILVFNPHLWVEKTEGQGILTRPAS